jgi:hypothetical protein
MRRLPRRWAGVLALLLGCGSRETPAGSADATAGSDGGNDASSDSTAMADANGPPGDAAGEVGRRDAVADSAAVSEAGSDGGAASDGALDGPRLEGGEAGARACDPRCVDVLTWHNDVARSGQNLRESALTPANVNPAQFGKLFVLPVDGKVDAQPLFVSAVAVAGKGTHDVLFVATEHDSLYAFDATSNTGASASPLWQVSLLGAGETTSDMRSCNQVSPEIGITATPVIDLATGTLYVVAMSKSGAVYFQRLHAIDIATGGEKSGSPIDIQATYPSVSSQSPSVVFDPAQYKERAGLLLLDGAVYLTWASHCDSAPYTGWVMAYDATTLRQVGVLDITPNGQGAASWGSGAGPAGDIDGNLYYLAGNGTFDTALDSTGMPAQKDFGNAMVKISTTGSLAVVDYFATWNTVAQTGTDTDFGSGGVMLLPDEVGSAAHPHLLVGAGKDGELYLVDRDHLGKWNGVDGGTDNRQIVQELTCGDAGGVFGAPAYFDHAIYYGPINAPLKRFVIDAGSITPAAASVTAKTFFYPGTTPAISANGAAAYPSDTAVAWAAENATPAVLYAYAATDLARELYTSAQADAGRDSFGDGNKFIVPTIANGRVYVGTTNGVGVFGLLP